MRCMPMPVMPNPNNDGSSTNDLMYVPTDAEIGAMLFDPYVDVLGTVQSAAVQQAAIKNFIAQEDYLRSRRGHFTEKYAGETPWFSQVDVRILQDYNFKPGSKTHTVQFSLDIQNFGNMISSKWGFFPEIHFYLQSRPCIALAGAVRIKVYFFNPLIID
jgi:hypothetical protein